MVLYFVVYAFVKYNKLIPTSWKQILHPSVFWQFDTFWWNAIILLKQGQICLWERFVGIFLISSQSRCLKECLLCLTFMCGNYVCSSLHCAFNLINFNIFRYVSFKYFCLTQNSQYIFVLGCHSFIYYYKVLL